MQESEQTGLKRRGLPFEFLGELRMEFSANSAIKGSWQSQKSKHFNRRGREEKPLRMSQFR
jgi:hypothetical protein